MRRDEMLLLILAVVAAGCGGAAPGARHLPSGSSSGSSATSAANTGSTGVQVTTGAGGHTQGSTAAASTSASAGSSGSSTAAAATSSSSTSSSGGSNTSSTSTTGSGTAATSTSGSGSTSSGSCYPDGSFPGGGIPCCSGYTDASGFCAPRPAPSSSTATSTSSTSGTTGTSGTTTSTTSSTGGSTGGSCSQACYAARGYHCENGECVLNGNTGPLQVTLYWGTTLQAGGARAREDLDLHMIDPSGCEIYYGNRSCGSGSLDLDSNAGCQNTDNPGSFGNDTENIIYAAGTPAHGTYQVFVSDYADHCDGAGDPNPYSYQVTVRVNGTATVYPGTLHQGDANGGQHTPPGWVHITDFTY